MTNPMCIHGKPVFERCLPCGEGLKRGEHGGFVRAPDPRPSKDLDVQPVMWLVFEYARIMDGADALVGEERSKRVAQAYAKDTEIRAAIRALVSSAHEPDPVPPKEPTPEWMLKARAEGRAEFLAILLGESAEDFANDYTGTHSIGCTDDYGVHWEVEKLRASFVVDDATYSYIDTINGNWWSQQHQIETLQEELEELKRAAQPPSDDLPPRWKAALDGHCDGEELWTIFCEVLAAWQARPSAPKFKVGDVVIPTIAPHAKGDIRVRAVETVYRISVDGHPMESPYAERELLATSTKPDEQS